jgi:thiamine-phosphate diphosphorylase
MLVTDRHRTRGRELVDLVTHAATAGPCLIQLREKQMDDRELTDLVLRIRERLPEEARLIVNGRTAVARATGCGLHLPASQPWPDTAGIPLVGRSAHDLAEGLRAVEEHADYVVLGPVYPTPSKPGHRGGGADLLRSVVPRLAPLPVFAIGGVERAHVTQLLRMGAHGFAVCRAILAADDPHAAAVELITAADEAV